MAAMTTGLADAEGFVTEAMLAWFEARARGGVGLVTVGPAAIDSAGRPPRELAIDNGCGGGALRLAAKSPLFEVDGRKRHFSPI